MNKRVSSSPDRLSFQLDLYIKSCEKEGKEPQESYIRYMKDQQQRHLARFETEESRQSNLEYDLLTTDWVLEKVRLSDTYAQNLYAALCNNDFVKNEVWDILKNATWSCSWRYAGGIIADMREQGDYIDWYCSGIRGGGFSEDEADWDKKRYMPEGSVTEEIEQDLLILGWRVILDK